MPVEEFITTIVQLVDAGLVDMVPGPPALYRILPPLRDVAVGDLIDERSRQQALHRLADYGIAEARAIGRGIRHGELVDDVEPRTIAMISVAHTAIGHLATTGDADRALELAGRLDAALYMLGWWTEKNQLLDRAIAIPGPPSAVRARALALRGRAGVLSQFDLGFLTEAEQMATALGDEMLAAYSGHLRGIALWWHAEYAASLAANWSAIERFSAAGRTIEELEARKFVGLALVQSGQIDDGLREQHHVLAGFERLGIAFHVAHSLALLGHSYRYVGDDDAAEVDLRASLDGCRLIGNRGTAIHVHLGLGDIAVDRGAPERAQRHATEAMTLITRSRLRTYEPWAWTLATRVAVLTGDIERAKGCGRKALSALEFAPGGDAARLAFELADVALHLDDPRRAARLIGVALRQTEPREMPLSSPLDEQRYGVITDMALTALGQDAAHHVTAGSRCTVAEAAGDLLQRPDERLT
jgi:tetratricopeptide (TPR) repeat protein